MKMWKTGYLDHAKFTFVGQINQNTIAEADGFIFKDILLLPLFRHFSTVI